MKTDLGIKAIENISIYKKILSVDGFEQMKECIITFDNDMLGSGYIYFQAKEKLSKISKLSGNEIIALSILISK